MELEQLQRAEQAKQVQSALTANASEQQIQNACRLIDQELAATQTDLLTQINSLQQGAVPRMPQQNALAQLMGGGQPP